MARVKRAVGEEDILAKEKVVSTPVRGGEQPAQYVVRVSDMDGKRNLSAPGGQQLNQRNEKRFTTIPTKWTGC
jgi:hypothetical protein